MFSSSSNPGHDYLLRAGLTSDRADSVIRELKKAGLNTGEIPVALEKMGADGLKQLLGSMDMDLEQSHRETVHVNFVVPKERHSFHLDIAVGDNLHSVERGGSTELAKYLECACGGVMACSTCHVILDAELFSSIPPPCEGELDMIDLAFGSTETSRLGCQLKISPIYAGKTITIPDGVTNFF